MEIDLAIKNALEMCEKQGIAGKNVTPFVLSEVSRVTKGVSMESSKEHVMNVFEWYNTLILITCFRHFFT